MGQVKLTNNMIAADASVGDLVGSFIAPVSGVTYRLQYNPNAYFDLSLDGHLYVVWTSTPTGLYPLKFTIQIHAHGSGFNEVDSFDILITPPTATTLPVPKTLTLTPDSLSIQTNIVSGTLSRLTVTTSDGSVFNGTFSVSDTLATVSGLSLILARTLTSADIGTHTFMVTATQNNMNVSTTFTLVISAVIAPPPPTNAVPQSISFIPFVPMIQGWYQLSDTTPIGTVVAKVDVVMSDGSVFFGSAMSGSNAYAYVMTSGNIITARQLTSADTSWNTFTATQNGVSISGQVPINVMVTVTSPPPPPPPGPSTFPPYTTVLSSLATATNCLTVTIS